VDLLCLQVYACAFLDCLIIASIDFSRKAKSSFYIPIFQILLMLQIIITYSDGILQLTFALACRAIF
jgi:hypothetical protein